MTTPQTSPKGATSGSAENQAHDAPQRDAINVWGYARVSTTEQRLDLQHDALLQAGVPHDHIITEKASGATPGARPERDRLLAALNPGDELVIWKLDRLGRSLVEIVGIIEDLTNRGIQLRSTQDSIDPTTPAGKLAISVMAAAAEYERSLIRERVIAGIASAKKRGVKLGRPTVLTPAQLHQISKMDALNATVAETAELMRISHRTVNRARQWLRAGNDPDAWKGSWVRS